MKIIRKFISILTMLEPNFISLDLIGIRIDPPDLIVKTRGNVVLSRFLICKDIELSTTDLSEKSARDVMESYVALLNALPKGVHLYIYKEEVDKGTLVRKITNDILNTQVDLDNAVEESARVKLSIKLNKLKAIYSSLLDGKPFARVALIVVYRVESNDEHSARSIADYYESIIISNFKNLYGLKLERADRSEITQFILSILGLFKKPSSNMIELDLERIAVIQPISPGRKPLLGKGIVLGYEKQTLHPVEIGVAELYRHLVIVGPTGRGKTTLLASIIEQIVSEGLAKIIAVDFKGDLKRYLPVGVLPLLTPDNVPINILEKPSEIEDADWRIVVVEAVSHAGGVSSEAVLKALLTIENLGESSLIRDYNVSVLIPFIELLKHKSDYKALIEYLRNSALVNVEKYGTAFQNAYIALLIGLIRYILLSRSDQLNTVLVVDDAWRILRLRTLAEIIREGRSRNLGVIISTQNPDDLPDEVIENTYNIVLFGSRNEEYLRKAGKMLGVKEDVLFTLSKLGIGEALYVNMLSKETIVIKTHLPQAISESNKDISA